MDSLQIQGWVADAVGVLGALSMVSSGIAAAVKPPSTNSPKWKQNLYKVATWPALNLGWARNAVLPGMAPEVQQLRLAAAKLEAKAPESVVVGN